MFEGLQRGRADVMLDPFRIAFRSLFVDSQAEEKRDDDPVSSAAGLGQLPTGIREEYGAIRFPPHQASSFEPRDVLGHGRRLHSKTFGDFHRPCLSARLDQFGDQFNVIFRHFALMCLTHGREPLSLCFGSPVDSFERFMFL